MLDVEILTGSNDGKRAFLPRIKLKTNASSVLPFVLSRKQFPVRLSFTITINKSQGQIIPNVGIYLPWHVFSHGQLYVTLSRGVSQNSTKVLNKEGKIEGEDGDFTKNVVFKDILLSQSYQCFFYITCHLDIYVMM
jgi:ATP-dependent DNA helicase PIF1